MISGCLVTCAGRPRPSLCWWLLPAGPAAAERWGPTGGGSCPALPAASSFPPAALSKGQQADSLPLDPGEGQRLRVWGRLWNVAIDVHEMGFPASLFLVHLPQRFTFLCPSSAPKPSMAPYRPWDQVHTPPQAIVLGSLESDPSVLSDHFPTICPGSVSAPRLYFPPFSAPGIVTPQACARLFPLPRLPSQLSP